MSGAVPVAATLKVAFAGAVTVVLAGWVLIEGATGAGFTVSAAGLLVTLFAEFFTVTVNVAPLSAVEVAGVV